MRQIVRYCASCFKQGVRTELSDTEPDVTIIVDRFGAHTDLCADCRDRLLGPVLEVMATGVELTGMSLADWSRLGQSVPTTRAIRRTQTAAAHSEQPSTAVAGGPYVCTICGQEFSSLPSLGGHRKRFGDRPHDRPKPRGAAAAKTRTSPQMPAQLDGQEDGPPSADS